MTEQEIKNEVLDWNIVQHATWADEEYAQPAGLWIRTIAFIIDFLILSPIFVAASLLVVRFNNPLFLIMPHIALIFYFPIMHSLRGYTYGKYQVGIRVLDIQGRMLSLPHAFARNFPLICFSLPMILLLLPIGTFPVLHYYLLYFSFEIYNISLTLPTILLLSIIFIPFNKKKQALHDIFAQTRCVSK